MSSVINGIVLAWRTWPVALVNYACGLLLAMAGALPLYAWWHRALADRPQGDLLLGGLHLMTLREIVQYDRSNVWGLALAAVGGVLLLGVLLGALIAGGGVEVLLTARGEARDTRPFFHRFFRGAGRFFGRNVRLMLLNGVTGLAVGAALLAAVGAGLSPLADSMVAWQAAATLVVPVVVAALLWVFFFLVQEYARVIVVAEDARGVFRAWLRGLRFVVRSPGSTLIAWAVPGLAGLLVGVGIAAATWASPVRTWSGILAIVAVQQMAMLFRSWTRVAVAGAAVDLGHRRGLVRTTTARPATILPVDAPPDQAPMSIPAASEDETPND